MSLFGAAFSSAANVWRKLYLCQACFHSSSLLISLSLMMPSVTRSCFKTWPICISFLIVLWASETLRMRESRRFRQHLGIKLLCAANILSSEQHCRVTSPVEKTETGFTSVYSVLSSRSCETKSSGLSSCAFSFGKMERKENIPPIPESHCRIVNSYLIKTNFVESCS